MSNCRNPAYYTWFHTHPAGGTISYSPCLYSALHGSFVEHLEMWCESECWQQFCLLAAPRWLTEGESKMRKKDQNPQGDWVASECCLMEKSMRLRAQKGVCVLGGFLDGLTKVGRNGQKRSMDRKGQPYRWMASWMNNELIITKMRSFSVMCGGVMGDLSRGDGGAMRRDYSMSMATFTPLPSCLEPVVAQELKALQVKSRPGRKYFQPVERNNSLVHREASWNIYEV